MLAPVVQVGALIVLRGEHTVRWGLAGECRGAHGEMGVGGWVQRCT